MFKIPSIDTINEIVEKERECEELNKAIETVEKLFNPSTSFGYPYTEDYANALRKVIEVAKKSTCRCDVEETDKANVEISGIIFHHGVDDYGLWEGFSLSEEDENAIHNILAKYDTQGCSVRGTRNEIAKEMEV